MSGFTDGPITVHLGDVRACLAELPTEPVQTVVTSPPYWGLRDYGTATWEGGDASCAHAVKADNFRRASTMHGGTTHQLGAAVARHRACKCGARRIDSQLGLEPTPHEYVDNMAGVFREVRRVLRKDGTLWLNLGDSYCSTDKWGGGVGGNTGKHTVTEAGDVPSWAVRQRRQPYGLKPKDLVGIPWRVAFALQADGWYLRSDIIWSKPNPMPESVTDRPIKAHEYLFLMSRSPRYYYDADAIREASIYPADDRKARADLADKRMPTASIAGIRPGSAVYAARNKRSVWTVATQPRPEAHFATYPEALVEPCIKAGSREGDTVLDPFAGSGTTLAVARRLGRKAIGIELNPAYIPLIQRRVAASALPLLEAIEASA